MILRYATAVLVYEGVFVCAFATFISLSCFVLSAIRKCCFQPYRFADYLLMLLPGFVWEVVIELFHVKKGLGNFLELSLIGIMCMLFFIGAIPFVKAHPRYRAHIIGLLLVGGNIFAIICALFIPCFGC